MTNYFAFYEIPISLEIHAARLRAKYYSYARKFHPDHNHGEEAEKMSAINNEAYQTLKNEEARYLHILKIHDMWHEGEQKLPQEFLMEVMDIQEEIMEIGMIENAEERETKRKNADEKIERFEAELSSELERLKEANISSDVLKDLKNYLLKMRYLGRMKEQLRKSIH